MTVVDIALRIVRILDFELLRLGCEAADWENDWKNTHGLILDTHENADLVSMTIVNNNTLQIIVLAVVS